MLLIIDNALDQAKLRASFAFDSRTNLKDTFLIVNPLNIV
jgi:hypothetical protein